ncbi:MAG: TetR/AcrR family transcriptional regulator [Acholeplasmatales bacterium]|nr:TetR/AcrR family transcriptional regulator [Acholeplasmatales bacterium]
MAEYRNSIRTRKQIKKAFAELLSEKNDISKITVKELVERADISKSTFYSHYDDMYSVEEEFEQEIIDLLNSLLQDYIKSHTLDYQTYVRKLISLLKENEEIYKKIFASDLPIKFIDNLKDICTKALNKDLRINLLSKDPKVRIAEIDFITNGTIHLFVDYFKGEIPQTLDEIGDGITSAMNLLFRVSK